MLTPGFSMWVLAIKLGSSCLSTYRLNHLPRHRGFSLEKQELQGLEQKTDSIGADVRIPGAVYVTGNSICSHFTSEEG